MFDIRNIVCPIDFSHGSERAMEHAMALASKYGATVHLLHVYPLDVFVGPDGGLTLTPEIVAKIAEQSTTGLEKLAAPWREKGHAVAVHVCDGMAAEETIRFAVKNAADLVVVGTHGRTGLSRMFMGSVAERIVRTSPIPVLTVRLPHD